MGSAVSRDWSSPLGFRLGLSMQAKLRQEPVLEVDLVGQTSPCLEYPTPWIGPRIRHVSVSHPPFLVSPIFSERARHRLLYQPVFGSQK